MAKGSFNFMQVKALYNSFYDKKGRLLDEPVGSIGRLTISDEAIRFLRNFIEFVVTSKISNRYTLIYLRSPASTLKEAFIHYNYMNPTSGVNVHTAISSMDYNRKQYLKLFPEDMLVKVLSEDDSLDLSAYWDALDKAYQEYGRSSFFDDLTIKLTKVVSSKRPTADELQWFKERIAPYTKKFRNIEQKEINESFKDEIGYLNYLAGKSDRSAEENEIYNEFMKIVS